MANILAAPQGCSMPWSQVVVCDFQHWRPPLDAASFNPVPNHISLHNVDGVLPSNSFGGLHGTGTNNGGRQLMIECGSNMQKQLALLSNTFSYNLAWVEEVSIKDCTNMQIANRAFSTLTGMTLMSIMSCNIASISSTAFYGLSSLVTLNIHASFLKSGIPLGLFEGLTGLHTLDMSRAKLNSIPLGLFDGLKNLRILNLSECGLASLPNNVFLPLLSLGTLDVSTNNFHCDCSLQWLGVYLQDQGFTKAKCSTPAKLISYDLSRALDSLSCPKKTMDESGNDSWKLIMMVIVSSIGFVMTTVALTLVLLQRRKINTLLSLGNLPRRARIESSTSSRFPTSRTLVVTNTVEDPTYNAPRKSRAEITVSGKSLGKVVPLESGPVIMKPHYFAGNRPMYDDMY